MLLPLNITMLCGRWKGTVRDVMVLCVEQMSDVIATGSILNSQLRKAS